MPEKKEYRLCLFGRKRFRVNAMAPTQRKMTLLRRGQRLQIGVFPSVNTGKARLRKRRPTLQINGFNTAFFGLMVT
ncbi:MULTISPECIES: hypothetical protein [unclassified Polaromonas]|uniref:hypothetical protein n=1 Tax=unclassified Polaromonas TaxID=2638319 RepID=UPI0018C958C8|nr:MULTISPECIES: hypothetical protein [unclassified Polaromonas]